MHSGVTTQSLDRPRRDEGLPPLERLRDPDDNGTSAADSVIAAERACYVAELLDSVTPMQADVLRKRFGIGSGTPMTLRQIAGEYGLSRERIRQIEKQALELLGRRTRSS